MEKKLTEEPRIVVDLRDVLDFGYWCEVHENDLEKDNTFPYHEFMEFVRHEKEVLKISVPDYVYSMMGEWRDHFNQWITEYLSRPPEKKYPI